MDWVLGVGDDQRPAKGAARFGIVDIDGNPPGRGTAGDDQEAWGQEPKHWGMVLESRAEVQRQRDPRRGMGRGDCIVLAWRYQVPVPLFQRVPSFNSEMPSISTWPSMCPTTALSKWRQSR